jgi:hypothetical protein
MTGPLKPGCSWLRYLIFLSHQVVAWAMDTLAMANRHRKSPSGRFIIWTEEAIIPAMITENG